MGRGDSRIAAKLPPDIQFGDRWCRTPVAIPCVIAANTRANTDMPLSSRTDHPSPSTYAHAPQVGNAGVFSARFPRLKWLMNQRPAFTKAEPSG